jgi:hypothetical protein
MKFIEKIFTVDNNSALKNHYLRSGEFGEHCCMELIMKIYALIKTLENDQKFKGYMRKRIDDLKKHYWFMPTVAALCSKEELEVSKRRKVEEIPEEIKIFSFIMDVCQCVEIVNNQGHNFFTYFPMKPKVYFLTSKSVNNFRAECRIEQSTAKLMDLMSYVQQFDIEMNRNLDLSEQYPSISKFLSADAFAFWKQA